ncbi:MAG: hypothetical protein JO111_10260 [Caulobacteraceae bacterium]|nr:hypothetical protein [Caulobacteraceae bacterium]
MKSSAIGGLAVFTTLACAMIGYVPRANAAPAPVAAPHFARPAVTVLASAR